MSEAACAHRTAEEYRAIIASWVERLKGSMEGRVFLHWQEVQAIIDDMEREVRR